MSRTIRASVWTWEFTSKITETVLRHIFFGTLHDPNDCAAKCNDYIFGSRHTKDGT